MPGPRSRDLKNTSLAILLLGLFVPGQSELTTAEDVRTEPAPSWFLADPLARDTFGGLAIGSSALSFLPESRYSGAGTLDPERLPSVTSGLIASPIRSRTPTAADIQIGEADGRSRPFAATLPDEHRLGLSIGVADASHPVPEDRILAWPQTILTAADGAVGDQFGESVRVDGETALVGAHAKNRYTGAVYVFTRNPEGTNNWAQSAVLTASDGVAFDDFGIAVSLDGDIALVGARGKGGLAGGAYVFSRNQSGSAGWTQTASLAVADADTGGLFGAAVSLRGDTALVGAPYKNGQTGAVYVFSRNQGGQDAWGQTAVLTASDSVAGDAFGCSVGVSDETVWVGAFAKNGSSGGAYVFGPTGPR